MKRLVLIGLLAVSVMWSCGGYKSADTYSGHEGDTLTRHSELLTLIDYGGYIVAEVKNPWDTASVQARYVLVDRASDSIPEIPGGTVVKVPLESSLVYSGVHAGIIDELGAVDAITAVADGGYFSTPAIVRGLGDGSVTDVGNSMSPSVEKIVEVCPEAIFASPYQNSGHGAIEALGIPIIECADYMEPTPLGRAEWIKLLGALYGEPQRADSIFRQVKTEYDSLCGKVMHVRHRPLVITEQVTDGVWYVPGGQSYMAYLIKDAGALYPWADESSTGSLQLDFSSVYDKAHNADFWLIRNYGNDLTLDALMSDNPLNARFKAFNSGGVYACNTAVSPLFDEFPFHPERLLKEFIAIFHPSCISDSCGLRYYKQVK